MSLEPDQSMSSDGGELDLTLQESRTVDIKPTVINPAPYNPHQAREVVRSAIALLLIVLLIITVAAAFNAFDRSERFENLKDLLAILYPPLIGIIGTMLGFYFGSEASKKD